MYLDAELLYMTIDISETEHKYWYRGNMDKKDTK